MPCIQKHAFAWWMALMSFKRVLLQNCRMFRAGACGAFLQMHPKALQILEFQENCTCMSCKMRRLHSIATHAPSGLCLHLTSVCSGRIDLQTRDGACMLLAICLEFR